MKIDESIAKGFLESLKMGEVIYEPDGNVTPDFLVGDFTAVEVRRLNQNYVDANGEKQGYENIEIRMWDRMRSMLNTFGKSTEGETWNIVIAFRRPVDWHKLKPQVLVALKNFQNDENKGKRTIKIDECFEFDILKSNRDMGSLFFLMGSCDNDSGGNILAEVNRNLDLCLLEKEAKVAPVRNKYKIWWLVLINYVDINMESGDYDSFKRNWLLNDSRVFERIFFLDLRDFNKWFEIT